MDHSPTTTKLAAFFKLDFWNSSRTFRFFDFGFGTSLILNAATSVAVPSVSALDFVFGATAFDPVKHVSVKLSVLPLCTKHNIIGARLDEWMVLDIIWIPHVWQTEFMIQNAW